MKTLHGDTASDVLKSAASSLLSALEESDTSSTPVASEIETIVKELEEFVNGMHKYIIVS